MKCPDVYPQEHLSFRVMLIFLNLYHVVSTKRKINDFHDVILHTYNTFLSLHPPATPPPSFPCAICRSMIAHFSSILCSKPQVIHFCRSLDDQNESTSVNRCLACGNLYCLWVSGRTFSSTQLISFHPTNPSSLTWAETRGIYVPNEDIIPPHSLSHPTFRLPSLDTSRLNF